MIKIPYYNIDDPDLVPTGGAQKSTEGGSSMYLANGFSMAFEEKNKVFLSFDLKDHTYVNLALTVVCGDFTMRIASSSTSAAYIKGTEQKSLDYNPYHGWANYQFGFSQESDGLHVLVSTAGYSFKKIYPDLKIGQLAIQNSYTCHIKNISVSESESSLFFLSSQDIAVDSIDNWEINSSNEYVLTNVDKTGVIHINQEKIDKLLADNDIVSCAIVMSTEKRGTKLKNMEFAIGDVKNSIEIPAGKSKVMIPLEFKNGTDMKNITLTVRG